MKKIERLKHEAGASLMEMLLTVGVLSLLLVMVVSFLQQYVREERMQAIADYMAMVAQAVKENTDTITEFSYLYNFVTDAGGQAEIAILAPSNNNRSVGYGPTGGVSLEMGGAPGISPNMIINAGFQPGLSADSRFRDMIPIQSSLYAGSDGPAANPRQYARLTLLVRAIDTVPDQRQLEFLLITVDQVGENDMRDIASKMAAPGGFLSGNTTAIDSDECIDNRCDLTVRGALGSWMTRIDRFNNTPWYTSAFSAPSNDSGYLAYYMHVNSSTLAGDYLYRKAIPGEPSLNTMYSDFDLGGNNILGADNIMVTGTDGVVAQQSVFAQGSLSSDGVLNVHGDMRVDGTVTATGSANVAKGYVDGSGRITNAIDPNIFSEGEFSARNMAVGERASVGGDAIASGNISVLRASTPQGDFIGRSTLTVTDDNTNGAFAQNFATTNIQVVEQTLSQAATANTFATPSLGTFSVDVDGNMSVGGTTNVPILGTNNLESRGLLVACEVGCDRED